MHTSKVTHLNEITLSNFNQLRVVESGRDLAPRDEWELLPRKKITKKKKKNNKRKLIKYLGCRLNTSEIFIITTAFEG